MSFSPWRWQHWAFGGAGGGWAPRSHWQCPPRCPSSPHPSPKEPVILHIAWILSTKSAKSGHICCTNTTLPCNLQGVWKQLRLWLQRGFPRGICLAVGAGRGGAEGLSPPAPFLPPNTLRRCWHLNMGLVIAAQDESSPRCLAPSNFWDMQKEPLPAPCEGCRLAAC